MPALPIDIARYTTDGIVVTAPTDQAVTDAIKADHIDARTGTEIEMFYDDAADGQWALNERFTYLRKVNPTHLGIEVQEAIELGSEIPLTPQVPSFRVVDPYLDVDVVARTRAYAHNMATDRFSVDVLA